MGQAVNDFFYKNLCLCLWLRAMKTYEKLHKFTDALSFFCTRQWKFSNQNMRQVWSMISEEDRNIFDFNISKLNWDLYLGKCIMGVRTFLLKDDPNKLSETIKKKKRYVVSGSWCILCSY
jgi:fatty acyl-CoA reductase